MTDEDSGQGGRSSGRWAIGDVAGELYALRRDLRVTDEITRESASLLSETAPKVGTLEEQVATLRGRVAALVDAAEHTTAEVPARTAAKAAVGLLPEPPGPWCWPLLDAEQATAAWQQLGRWVGELLVPTYAVTRGQLPDCWPRHPRMVAELTWLRQAYLEAHQRGAPATKTQDWHLRGLPGALAAITAAIPINDDRAQFASPLCGPNHHLQRPEIPVQPYDDHPALPGMPAAAEHWGEAWREARDADVAGRRPAPGRGQKGGSSS